MLEESLSPSEFLKYIKGVITTKQHISYEKSKQLLTPYMGSSKKSSSKKK